MVRGRSRSRTRLTTTLAPSRDSVIAISRCCTRRAMSATTLASSAFRSGRTVPSANTRTGMLYFRMRSTRPARWNSAPNAVLRNPSMISVSVKVFFSARWREAMAGISAEAAGSHAAPSNAIATRPSAMIPRRCESRKAACMRATLPQPLRTRKADRAGSPMERRGFPESGAALILHDDGGADGDPAIEIGHVVIGHPEAARGHRLTDGLGLVRAVNPIERRAQIDGAGAQRVIDAARHVARQVGPPRQHLRRRCPARPFLLGGDAVDAAPAKTVAADADAVAQRLAVGQHQIKPPLGGVHHNGARRVVAVEIDGGARNRADAGHEIGAASHDIATVETLGLRQPGSDRQGERRHHKHKSPSHVVPHAKPVKVKQAIFAAISQAAPSQASIPNGRVNSVALAMAAMPCEPLTKPAGND